MISERLYELAFQYKKTQLWKVITEQQIFALPLSDDVTGYVSIMGHEGEFSGINLYLNEGFDTYRRLSVFSQYDFISSFEEHEWLLGQDCLQLAWGEKDDLTEEELKQVRKIARAQKISLRGKEAYPFFRRFAPSCLPWQVTDETEQNYLEQTLEAVLAIADLHLENEIKTFKIQNKTVSSLMHTGDLWTTGKRVKVPAVPNRNFPQADPARINSIGVRKIKKLRQKDVMECALLMLPTPVQDNKDQPPHCPYMIMAVMQKTAVMLEFMPVSRQQLIEEPEKVLNEFIEDILKEKVRPSAFYCEDERTYQLLEPLAGLLDIQVVVSEYLDELEECEYTFEEYLDSEVLGDDDDGEDDWDDMEDEADYEDSPDGLSEDDAAILELMIHQILDMPPSQFKKLPAAVKDALKEIIQTGQLPEDLEKQLRRKLDMK